MEEFIFVQPPEVTMNFTEPSELVFFEGVGSIGPPGPSGPVGEGLWLNHIQTEPSATWTILHNLGKQPAGIKIIQSDGGEVEGEVSYPDPNTVVIKFANARSGQAFLS